MTFVELIVTIAIVSVVVIALFSLIQAFYKDNTYLIEETSALASTRRGVTKAVTDIREASYGDDGSYPIAQIGTSTLTVYTDVDKDTYVEKVTYQLLNNVLYRSITQATGSPPVYASTSLATTTVATDVRNTASSPLFTYYDDAGTVVSAASTSIAIIRSIQVQLLVDLNPQRAPNVFTLTELSTLRNLSSR